MNRTQALRLAYRLLDAADTSGGGTFIALEDSQVRITLVSVPHGVAVGGVVPSFMAMAGSQTARGLARWVERWEPVVGTGRAWGCWVNADGEFCADVVDVVPNVEIALELGRHRGEYSVFDLCEGKEHPCG